MAAKSRRHDSVRRLAAAIAKTGDARFVAHELMPVGDKIKALEQSFRLFA